MRFYILFLDKSDQLLIFEFIQHNLCHSFVQKKYKFQTASILF